MGAAKVYIHPLSERICFRGFYPNLHDGGVCWLSTAMSEKLRCAPELYSLSEGMQISPARRKPKKHVVYAAHAMMLSKSSGCLLRKDLI